MEINKDGTTIPKRVLIYFKDNPNILITRDNLTQIIYGGYWRSINKTVADTYINAVINHVRGMLGSDANKLITVRGRRSLENWRLFHKRYWFASSSRFGNQTFR